MRLAFPTTVLPHWDLPAVVHVAAANGLGIELHASRSAQQALTTNLLFTDPDRVRTVLAEGGVTLVAVWMTVPLAAAGVVVDEVARVADVAVATGCALIRLVESRPTPTAALHDAGNAAARAGVSLTIDNQPLCNGVFDLWRRLDAVDHPSVGCCLDTLNLTLGGDGPSVAVPTLGSRIAHVRLRHPATDAEAVHRLAGIGYCRWASIDPAAVATVRAWLPKPVRT